MYREVILERWRRQGMEQRRMQVASQLNPFLSRRVAAIFSSHFVGRGAPKKGRMTRLVLDFHPILECARIQATIDKVVLRWSGELAQLGFAVSVGLAWRGAAKPLGIRLRQLGAVASPVFRAQIECEHSSLARANA